MNSKAVAIMICCGPIPRRKLDGISTDQCMLRAGYDNVVFVNL